MTNPTPSDRSAPLRWSPILLLALFVTLLVASAGPRQADAEESSATRPAITVFLVRHAEKGTDDPRDPSLTEAGKRRADELARLLSAAKVTHLFSSDYRRTLQTVAPLAAGTELQVERYDARALSRLAERLKRLEPGSVAVVAGHSNTTPDLYAALGGGVAADLVTTPSGAMKPRAGGMIPDAKYDRLYEVTLLRDAKGSVKCVSSLELRYGDR